MNVTTLPTAARTNERSREPVRRSLPQWWRDSLLLAKPRIAMMVLITVAIGFIIAAQGRPALEPLVWTVFGVGATAVASSVLNQVVERRTDGLMLRTQFRPLPAGRMDVRGVLVVGSLLGFLGITILAIKVNALTAMLAAATLITYVLVYTPLKRVTVWNTFVGAIPGAMPPALGYVGAANAWTPEATFLFGLLFLWQFPHFWAIAWMYRDDYERAGLWMLPAIDREQGRRTGRWMIGTAALLLAFSLWPGLVGQAGWFYTATAGLLGGLFLAASVRFWQAPDRSTARGALLASLIHLPLVLLMLVLDGTFRILS